VVEIVRRHLAPAGVFFISYNCLPGWTDELPLRHLMALHAERAPGSQPLKERIDASLAFAQSLLDAGAKTFTAHPALQAWLKNLRSRSPNYLAHEYFNRDWHPMPSSEVARAMAGAGLVFGASATLDDESALSQEAKDLMGGLDDPVLRETVLDYFSNTRFRSDLFVKAGIAADSRLLHERIADIRFVLLHRPDYVRPEIHRPFAEAMAKDAYSPKTLREIGATSECSGMSPQQLAATALVLTQAGYLHPAQTPDLTHEAVSRCKGLNAEILRRTGLPNEITALASPVTGAGVVTARKEMMFLRARTLGHAQPDDWARYAWDTCGEGDATALRSEAAAFARIRLPVFEALGIA
jgi:hypothetical protein